MLRQTRFPLVALLLFGASKVTAAPPEPLAHFLEDHCVECHDSRTKKGGLDLDALSLELDDPTTFAEWVKVHDRLAEHEMPPKDKKQPAPADTAAFLKNLAGPLITADRQRAAAEGRSILRRLNRDEYENTLRDLFGAPWLRIKDLLPEDGEAFRFNKVGEALDVSHVHLEQYLAAADYALRDVLGSQLTKPEKKITRHYAREQPYLAKKLKLEGLDHAPERHTFAILGAARVDLPALEGTGPTTVGASNPAVREEESLGVVSGSYQPIEPKFDGFKVPTDGHYKLRFAALSFWTGPASPQKWWHPSRTEISTGRTREPVCVYAETPPRLNRKLGAFDVTPEPSIHELDVWLRAGEIITVDAARLFRSRPPNYHNPLAENDGMPGVAYRWMEVEGPIIDTWPSTGQKLIAGDLPLKKGAKGLEIVPRDPHTDPARLLRAFMERACQEPVQEADVQRFAALVQKTLEGGSSFTDAMVAGYSAVLCSPVFVCLEEKPGRLDDRALAARLAYFLWNSPPDQALRDAAARGDLRDPAKLRAQTERMLADPRSSRFVNAFLDYWLDLRKIEATSPDAALYPDYYLDDLLTESAIEETQKFFAALVQYDLPSGNIVDSNFAMLNERLAAHYGFPTNAKVAGNLRARSASTSLETASIQRVSNPGGAASLNGSLVEGIAIRPVRLPPDSLRGGLMTQASVLKVTANGTTTSPVLRGVWIMERIVGKPAPPPPASVPAIDPDTRGATTIREQLAKHRSQATCAACHAKIDPAGFALENFDVLGGWRDHYRALGEGGQKLPGFGKNGQPYAFHWGPAVEAGGVLPDGRKFDDIRSLKRLLLADQRQIARNLTRQLLVFATGAPVRFGDRPEIEQILDRAQPTQYGVRTLIREIVQSNLFQIK
jgi:mono/diheme cytochrome c family protein